MKWEVQVEEEKKHHVSKKIEEINSTSLTYHIFDSAKLSHSIGLRATIFGLNLAQICKICTKSGPF